MINLNELVYNAFGGIEFLKSIKAIDYKVETEGILFLTKVGRYSYSIRGNLELNQAKLRIYEFPLRTEFTELSDSEILIFSKDRVLSKANNFEFQYSWFWDFTKLSYFLSYAIWNYIAFPSFFYREEIQKDWLTNFKCKLNFPKNFPTHSTEQIFIFTEDYKLKQIEYHANLVHPIAYAKNSILDYSTKDGFIYPSFRKVYPKFFESIDGIVNFPKLVQIKIQLEKVYF